jgi:uncharacterized protein (TIGR03083 family)
MDSFEPPPILCAAQLRKVDGKLLELLDSLRAEEWQLPTLAPGWTVGDVAGHLLDTALRKLSMVRDHWIVEQPEIRSARDLSVFVNRMNHEGVAVYRRLSPAVLTSWLRAACRASAEFHESLDPFAPAAFAVSWAGEDRSLNWFDTARELTERWHHQQQIRHATGRPGIMTPELYHPVLDCFLRGLPYAWRDIAAPEGTCAAVEIAGDCGGIWQLRKEGGGWRFAAPSADCAARIAIPQEIAWRVFTRGIARAEAEQHVHTKGDRDLALRVLDLTAIVA